MKKRKDGHSSNQTMVSSSYFTTLAKAETAWLHCKGIRWKEIYKKKKKTKKTKNKKQKQKQKQNYT